MNSVWLVYRWMNEECTSLEFVGIFATEEKGIAACLDRHYAVGRFELDKDYGEDPIPDSFWFPTEQEKPVNAA